MSGRVCAGYGEPSSNGRLAVSLYVAAPLPLVVLELSPSCAKCVAQRDIRVLVSVIRRVGVPDRDFLLGQRDVDSEVVQKALMLVTRGWLHDDMAAHDVLAEPVEFRGELANTGLESRGGVHLAKGDLQRKDHAGFPESTLQVLAHGAILVGMRINPDMGREATCAVRPTGSTY